MAARLATDEAPGTIAARKVLELSQDDKTA